MQDFVEVLDACSTLIVPLIAIWAILCVYTVRPGAHCHVTECCFFFSLMLVACCTVRTVAINDSCWLQHTATLGAMVVSAALKRPRAEVSGLES